MYSNLQGVASAHDQIAARVYDETKMLPDQFDELALNDPTDTSPGAVQAVRVVGLRKTPGEPLGLTLKVEDFTGQLKVSRILDGGEVDKQGFYLLFLDPPRSLALPRFMTYNCKLSLSHSIKLKTGDSKKRAMFNSSIYV